MGFLLRRLKSRGEAVAAAFLVLLAGTGCRQGMPLVRHLTGAAENSGEGRAEGKVDPGAARWPASAALVIRGRVEFPGRQLLLTPGEAASQATITLFGEAGQALAVGLTDAGGNFSLDPGAGFAPAQGSTYVLDAYKGAASSGIGAEVARLRTRVSWTGSGWSSVSGTTVKLDALTTAVCIIQGLDPALRPSDVLFTVSGSTVTSSIGALARHWQAVANLVTDLLAVDQDPVARIRFEADRYFAVPDLARPLKLERFEDGTFAETALDAGGALQMAGPRPSPNDPISETAYFQCQGMNNDGAGVVVSDGRYLYVKAWSGYANVTADAHTWKRIGTGFGGTVRGQNYGKVGTPTPMTHSAAYWNGGIYQGASSTSLLRVDTTTGAQSTVNTAAVMIERSRGVPGRPTLLTSDGTYLYNLAYGINARNPDDNNGFTIQVLDPAAGFALRRQFSFDTQSFYTDGFFVDGTYVYPVEWTGRTARVRRYRLSDGFREAEWTFDQTYGGCDTGYTATAIDAIAGAYDPVNKVFWIGNLCNDKVHMLRGGPFLAGPSATSLPGVYTSPPLDTGSSAPHFGRLTWSATTPAGTLLALVVRSADTLADLGAAGWTGPGGPGTAYTASGGLLNPIHARQRYLQVRATLGTADPAATPRLRSVAVEVLP